MANMMMVQGARAIAPVVDTFVGMTQRFMEVGKRYMEHLDGMLAHMDMDPQMRLMAEAVCTRVIWKQEILLDITRERDEIEAILV